MHHRVIKKSSQAYADESLMSYYFGARCICENSVTHKIQNIKKKPGTSQPWWSESNIVKYNIRTFSKGRKFPRYSIRYICVVCGFLIYIWTARAPTRARGFSHSGGRSVILVSILLSKNYTKAVASLS